MAAYRDALVALASYDAEGASGREARGMGMESPLFDVHAWSLLYSGVAAKNRELMRIASMPFTVLLVRTCVVRRVSSLGCTCDHRVNSQHGGRCRLVPGLVGSCR